MPQIDFGYICVVCTQAELGGGVVGIVCLGLGGLGRGASVSGREREWKDDS